MPETSKNSSDENCQERSACGTGTVSNSGRQTLWKQCVLLNVPRATGTVFALNATKDDNGVRDRHALVALAGGW